MSLSSRSARMYFIAESSQIPSENVQQYFQRGLGDRTGAPSRAIIVTQSYGRVANTSTVNHPAMKTRLNRLSSIQMNQFHGTLQVAVPDFREIGLPIGLKTLFVRPDGVQTESKNDVADETDVDETIQHKHMVVRRLQERHFERSHDGSPDQN